MNDNKCWLVSVTVPGESWEQNFPNCKGSVQRSGVLLIVDQTEQTIVAGFARDGWLRFGQERKYVYEVVK